MVRWYREGKGGEGGSMVRGGGGGEQEEKEEKEELLITSGNWRGKCRSGVYESEIRSLLRIYHHAFAERMRILKLEVSPPLFTLCSIAQASMMLRQRQPRP